MHDAVKVIRNTILLGSGRGIIKLISLVWYIFLLRYLHKTGYGDYITLYYSYYAIFILLGDLGTSTIITREISKKKEEVRKFLDNALSLRVISGIIVAIFMFLGGFFFQPGEIRTSIYLLCLMAIFYSLYYTIFGMFRAYEKLQYETGLIIFNRISSIIFALLFMFYFHYGVLGVIIGLFMAELFTVIGAIIIALTKFKGLGFKWDTEQIKFLLKEGLPLGVTSALIIIYFKIDALMLYYMKGSAAVGIYGAPYKILDTLALLGSSFVIAAFPYFSRLFAQSKDSLLYAGSKSLKLTLLVSVPLAVVGTFLADKLVLFAGIEYKQSVHVLQILMWTVIFMFMNYVILHILTAAGRQILNMIGASVCVVVNVVLNLFLIPKYTYFGCSFATVITEATLTIIGLYFIIIYLGSPRLTATMLKISLSSILMALVFLGLYRLSIYLGFHTTLYTGSDITVKSMLRFCLNIIYYLPFGCLAYLCGIFGLKTLDEKDLSVIKSIFSFTKSR